jgi:Tfp pilus assembly protein PilO
MKGPIRSRQPIWRQRLLLPAIVLLGLNAAVFLVYTLPNVLRERTITSRIGALRTEVERQRGLAASLEKRAETLRQNAEDTKRFYGEVVGTRSARLVPMLREIEKIARSQGLQTGHAGYSPKELKDTPLVRFGITMPISGSYDKLVSFLEGIERSKQFLIVDSMTLRERLGEGVDLNVEMSAYFHAGDEGAGRGQ